ncbi:MAG TPA: class I SAM-dependent methyltransferase [Acidimicrobiales bacterium]|nr:class I SAM-dependent methyltransferase [Acidimicrobiales bacterium]
MAALRGGGPRSPEGRPQAGAPTSRVLRSRKGALAEGWRAAASTWRSQPPERYRRGYRVDFQERLAGLLRPGMAVLDVGAGGQPSLEAAKRPPGCHWVGLDVSAAELAKAPPGSYDEVAVGSVTELVPSLVGGFDLVLSFQVLEHVKPLDRAIDNIEAYLKPGGWFLGQLSGALTIFALLNRLLPHRLSIWALKTLRHRAPETVFPAHYHHCWARALERDFLSWSSCQVLPNYLGSDYLSFFRPLQALHVGYEEWAMRAGHANLASHYLVVARR